mgnify:CR=1 FL=1
MAITGPSAAATSGAVWINRARFVSGARHISRSRPGPARATARVIAAASTDEKLAVCKAHGADELINYGTGDLRKQLKEICPEGPSVIYDPVGGDTFHQVRRCMGWDSRLLVIGFVAGIPEVKTNHALLKSYSMVGVHWGASLAKFPNSLGEQMTTLLDMAASGTIDPPLYPPFAFADAAQALQDIADRKVHGKAVVTV